MNDDPHSGEAWDVDVLLITYNRPHYTRLSLEALLASAHPTVRVWIWHNGDHAETLSVVRAVREHPAVYRYHESPENVGLYPPIQWVMSEGRGAYVSKVDDDCLLPVDWIPRLVRAHQDNPEFGILGCWRFQNEDYDERLASKKTVQYNGHRVLRNHWVEGSGFLLKRSWLEKVGGLRPQESVTAMFVRVSLAGAVNGWLVPFVHQDHMDDPRSPHTGIKTNADLINALPLSAKRFGVQSADEWCLQLRRSARYVQVASTDGRWYRGVLNRVRQIGLYGSNIKFMLELRLRRWFGRTPVNSGRHAHR